MHFSYTKLYKVLYTLWLNMSIFLKSAEHFSMNNLELTMLIMDTLHCKTLISLSASYLRYGFTSFSIQKAAFFISMSKERCFIYVRLIYYR